MRYNPPPTWPAPPPGWQPPAGWQAPPEWGPPPPGWQFWVDERPPRPSVWSTIGIALASAVVIGVPLGLVFAPDGGNPSYWMGRGFGYLLLPAVGIGWLWPYAVPRTSRWFVPLVVLVVGGTLAVVVNAANTARGNADAHARLTDTPGSSAPS